MTHEVITFAEVLGKKTENNPAYKDGRLTAIVVTPHQRSGGKVIELAFEASNPARPQSIARGNFKEAVKEWGDLTGAYSMAPEHELVVGSMAMDFRGAHPDDTMSARQVLAAIQSAPTVHFGLMQADEQIG